MDPMTLGAVITGASTLVSGAANVYTGAKLNKKNRAFTKQENARQRQFASDSYDKARTHSVMDRDHANEWNRPEQQMKRLKEAGLNPRLIYGGSSGFQSAQDTRGNQQDSPRTQAEYNDPALIGRGISEVGASMGQFIEMVNLQAKTDNLRETRELIEAQTKAQIEGTGYTGVRTQTEKYNLDYAKRTEQQRIEKLEADLHFTTDTNSREWALLQQKYDKFNAEIANINLSSTKTLAEIKKLGIETETIQILQDLQATEITYKQMVNLYVKYGISVNSDNIFNQIRKMTNNRAFSGELYDIYSKSRK